MQTPKYQSNIEILALLALVMLGCNSTRVPQTIPTSTVPSSPTATKPPSPSPIPQTLTPIPTIPNVDQEGYVLDLISSNGGCELPCWWGITAGISTWQDLPQVLGSVYSPPVNLIDISGVYEAHFGYIFESSNPVDYSDAPSMVMVDFLGSQDDINRILVYFSILLDWESRFSPVFADAAKLYSLHSVLGQYGAPSRVLLDFQDVPMYPGTWELSHLWLIYDELDFLIEYYPMGMIFIDENVGVIDVCPYHQIIYGLNIILRASDDDTPLTTIASSGRRTIMHEYKNLKSFTDFTGEDFYDLFLNPEEEKCLQFPLP